jgi:high-affinity nickel-transport protein
MIHGIGAETGSQALVLAAAAGATSSQAASLMLIAFVLGLLISNSLVAAFTAFGFVSAQVKQTVYLALAIPAGALSLVIGTLFVLGQGAALPDIQQLIDWVFGPSESSEL